MTTPDADWTVRVQRSTGWTCTYEFLLNIRLLYVNMNDMLYYCIAVSATHASIKSLCNSCCSHLKDKISIKHSAFRGHTPDIVNADSP